MKQDLCRIFAVALMVLAVVIPSVALSQQAAPGQDDPAQDILIEGIGFAKLIIRLDAGENFSGHEAFERVNLLLEKNLCWSGVFNLTGGKTRFCPARSGHSRLDMRLELTVEKENLSVRLVDNGPESLVLHQDALPLSSRLDETRVMDLVNRLTEKITGQPGLLGSTIAFVLRQPRYAKVIVSTNTHGEKISPISNNRGINLLPKWSPNGLSMVYTVLNSEGTQVFFHNFGKNGNAAGKNRYLTDTGTLNTGGSFSPDGKLLVLTMSVEDSADLFQLDLNNNSRKRLTSRSGIETQADWSKKNNKVVFVSDRSGTPQVYLLDMETREDLRITFDGIYNGDPKWSPDGRLILFTKRVGMIDQIHIMDQYGENVRPVTRGRFFSEQAEWSPDGRQIVFASNRTGDFKLYVVSTDGSNLRRLTNTPKGFEESSPSWTHRRMTR